MRSRKVSRREKKILQFKKLLYDPDLEPWLAETFALAFQMRMRIEKESSEDANGLKREVERAVEDLVKGGASRGASQGRMRWYSLAKKRLINSINFRPGERRLPAFRAPGRSPDTSFPRFLDDPSEHLPRRS
jgi:hypothetical protein